MNTTETPQHVTANERQYAWPVRPAIVICLDGCEPAYLDVALARGKMPALAGVLARGSRLTAHSVIPSFTNPNNLSIVTGRPPSVHGICGNFLYDPNTGEAVMMNDPRFLRAPTVFKNYYDAGAKLAIVTAKDKLRALLGHGLAFDDQRAICFSSEKSDTTTLAEHGIENASAWLQRPVPDVYSAGLSEFVFAAGVKLLKEFKPDVMYLTTTDYVQHKYGPEDEDAIAFYEMFDHYLAELDAAGAAIIITADHGMKPKHYDDGSPQVIYLQDVLDGWLGKSQSRVILPITDPYVVHHGALGSYATAYVPEGTDIAELVAKLSALDELQLVLSRDDACAQFELPPDRVGDVVMVSTENMTIGTSADEHDLSGLDVPLRSHGGLTEQEVPFIANGDLGNIAAAPSLRNFDAFLHATQLASSPAA